MSAPSIAEGQPATPMLSSILGFSHGGINQNLWIRACSIYSKLPRIIQVIFYLNLGQVAKLDPEYFSKFNRTCTGHTTCHYGSSLLIIVGTALSSFSRQAKMRGIVSIQHKGVYFLM